MQMYYHLKVYLNTPTVKLYAFNVTDHSKKLLPCIRGCNLTVREIKFYLYTGKPIFFEYSTS